MIKADSVALDINLRDFSYFLQSKDVRHRISEETGQQVIWVEGEHEAEFVRNLLREWPFDLTPAQELQPRQPFFSGKKLANSLLRGLIENPISVCLIVICIIVALVSELGARADRVDFLFYPLLPSDSLFALLSAVNTVPVLLRTLTPIFLHFGELHLIFNLLWLWYFGKQLESIHPPWQFGALILATAFAGNTAQYLYSNFNNFGGMSGVVYGLVGYTWIIHSFMPRSRLMLNNSMFVIFVIALIAMELLASSWIASAAHVGGLVMGLLLGALMVVYYRFVLGRTAISR